jgi:hypothetical protein
MVNEADKLDILPGSVPVTPIIWPADSHTRNKIQQLKAGGVPQAPFVLPGTQPAKSAVAPRTTPQPVSRLRISSKTEASQKTITVKFTHPGGDLYFQGASVYLKRAGGQPTQVASGAKSPLTFTVPVTAAPHSVFITSYGPYGETDVNTAPSARLKLS